MNLKNDATVESHVSKNETWGTRLYTAQQNEDGTVSLAQTKLSDQQYNQAREELEKMDNNGMKPEDKEKK